MNSHVFVLLLKMKAGAVPASAVPPSDDDTLDGAGDTLTITAFTDCDGATLRAPRVTVLHAADSLRNADLIEPDRLEMDRHYAKSNRVGRDPRRGITHRILAFTSRAGEVFAPRNIVIEVATSGDNPIISAADTTSRSASDGSTNKISEWHVSSAANSLLNSALLLGPTSVQRRYASKHALDRNTRGLRHRIVASNDGAAGAANVPLRFIVEFNVSGDNETRARDH